MRASIAILALLAMTCVVATATNNKNRLGFLNEDAGSFAEVENKNRLGFLNGDGGNDNTDGRGGFAQVDSKHRLGFLKDEAPILLEKEEVLSQVDAGVKEDDGTVTTGQEGADEADGSDEDSTVDDVEENSDDLSSDNDPIVGTEGGEAESLFVEVEEGEGHLHADDENPEAMVEMGEKAHKVVEGSDDSDDEKKATNFLEAQSKTGCKPNCKAKSKCRVTFYQHANYKGNRKTFVGSSSWIGVKQNDKYSSLRVSGGCFARVFQHSKYRGKSVQLIGSVPNLAHLKMNDMISSFRLVRLPSRYAILYQHVNFRGYGVVMTRNQNSMPVANDQFSSIRVRGPRGIYVQLFQHNSFKGKRYDVRGYDRDFRGEGFNDMISSVRFKRLPVACYAILYEHVNYKGYAHIIKRNERKVYANDKYSSIRVSGNCEAQIYQHYNYAGKSIKIRSRHSDFRKIGYNDIVSSIKLRGR